jgi:hypothetical protein
MILALSSGRPHVGGRAYPRLMTWVVGIAGPAVAVLIGDVRISVVLPDGSSEPLESVGVRKTIPFSNLTAVGIAGALQTARECLSSMYAYMGTTGADKRPLVEHAKEWVSWLYSNRHPLTRPASIATELLMLRSRRFDPPGVTFAAGCKIGCPSPATGQVFRVQQMASLKAESIGSGSEMPTNKAHLEAISRKDDSGSSDLDRLVNLAALDQRQAIIGLIIGRGIGQAIESHPHPTVSSDITACVLTWSGAVEVSTKPPVAPILHLERDWDRIEQAARERVGRSFALCG